MHSKTFYLNQRQKPFLGRFSQHHYSDLEIIIIPISGATEYSDSRTNRCIAERGDVIVIGAGSGVRYAVNSISNTEESVFLSAWVLPRKRGLTSNYLFLKLNNEKLTYKKHNPKHGVFSGTANIRDHILNIGDSIAFDDNENDITIPPRL